VGINRGHLNEILNKKVDPKLSTVFRMTRRVDRCPNVLLCEICARTFGPCVHAIDPEDVVPDVKTLRDLHSGHPNRRESDCS